MSKSTDRILFESIMRLPRTLQHKLFEVHGELPEHMHGHHHHEHGERRPDQPPHGPCGRHPHHGPMRQGKGPFSRERVLEILLDQEEGMRQKEVAEQLHINPSSMSEMIDRLEADHYLIRTVDPSDRRATLIRLTDLGSARACELQDEKDARIAPLFQKLSEDEKQELIRLIQKLTESETEEA